MFPKCVPWRMPSQSHLFLIVKTPHLLNIPSVERCSKGAAKVPFFRHKRVKLCASCEWGDVPNHTCILLCFLFGFVSVGRGF